MLLHHTETDWIYQQQKKKITNRSNHYIILVHFISLSSKSSLKYNLLGCSFGERLGKFNLFDGGSHLFLELVGLRD